MSNFPNSPFLRPFISKEPLLISSQPHAPAIMPETLSFPVIVPPSEPVFQMFYYSLTTNFSISQLLALLSTMTVLHHFGAHKLVTLFVSLNLLVFSFLCLTPYPIWMEWLISSVLHFPMPCLNSLSPPPHLFLVTQLCINLISVLESRQLNNAEENCTSGRLIPF